MWISSITPQSVINLKNQVFFSRALRSMKPSNYLVIGNYAVFFVCEFSCFY